MVGAFEAGDKTVVAATPTDTWALGVMAFELLTGSRAFSRDATSQQVCDEIMGRRELPWEGARADPNTLNRMRVLKRSVLQCLSRVPAERPSAAALVATWESIFDRATSAG